MSEMYWSAFKLPLNRTRDVGVVYSMAVQTITSDARPLYRYQMQASEVWSPRGLKNVYGHQNTTHEPGIAGQDDVVPFLHPALSFCALKLSSLSMLHRQEKPKKWSSSWQVTLLQTSPQWKECCKHAHFMSNCPWCTYTVLQGWPHHLSVLLGVSQGRALRSCTLSNQLIPYSNGSGWMSTISMGDIKER